MTSQRAIEALAGPARLAPYVTAADGDVAKATDLYVWAAQLAGALHWTVSFVEVAFRNALDAQLIEWNAAQPGHFGQDWALRDSSTTTEADLIEPIHPGEILMEGFGIMQNKLAVSIGVSHDEVDRAEDAAGEQIA